MNNQNQQLDPSILALSRAIGKAETGGKYDAKGKSGEYGAYQFMPETWKTWAKKHLGDENAQMTPENQDKVVYSQIKEWGSQGYKPAQIASLWNSGKPEWEGNVGVNKAGVKFDTPSYVKSVGKAYEEYMKGNEGYQPENTPSTVEEPQKEGFFSSIFRGITQPVATLLARPIQAGAELLGASPEQVNQVSSQIPFYGKDHALDVPTTAGDVFKDVGRGAQTVALGLPVGSIGQAVKMGALAGAGSGLEQSGTMEGTLQGGALGSALGLGGGLVGKALSVLPKSIIADTFKGLDDAQIAKVLKEKSLGTGEGLLKQSQKAIDSYGRQIDTILQNTTEKGAGDFAIRATTTQFPEYAGRETAMLDKIKRLIPSGVDRGLEEGIDRATILKYIDKIADGTATLYEKNKVRSVIDSATKTGWSKLAKSLNPSAGHDMAMTFANNLRTEVQQTVKETIPLFAESHKEIGIREAIKKAQKTKRGFFSYKDIIPFLTGSATLGSPLGGFGAVLAERLWEKPAIRFGTAKIAQGIGKGTTPVVGRAGLLSNLLNKQPTQQ